MIERIILTPLLWLVIGSASIVSAQTYFPTRTEWRTKTAEASGFKSELLSAAIAFAKESESNSPRDQEEGQARSFGREPFGEPIGPFKTRGEPSGIIIRSGFIVANWGDQTRVDMTHSVTKSFLTATIGLAYDRGVIADLSSLVFREMSPISVYPQIKHDDPGRFGKSKFLDIFESDHNKTIDWDSLMRQTSDWEGALWGKPDWADRPDRDPSKWQTRPRNVPGEVFEYNDVRVNLLALAALNVIREPLPIYLRKHLMDQIGASNTWRWHGYENSYILLDGNVVQSVSGGGHWGGGMFINVRDLARFGLLIENEGKWGEKDILSKTFLAKAESPTKARPTYGFMNFFLNTNRELYPSAPEGTIAFLGNGTNIVYIDKKNDLVIVARWIEGSKIDEFLGKIYAALNE